MCYSTQIPTYDVTGGDTKCRADVGQKLGRITGKESEMRKKYSLIGDIVQLSTVQYYQR